MPHVQRLLTSRAIKLAGSKSELARVLGITRQSVGKWGKWVPPLRFYELVQRKPEWIGGPVISTAPARKRK